MIRSTGQGGCRNRPRLLSLNILIVDLWAITKIFQSHESSIVKILWIVTVALIPLFGFSFWYFMGPRKEQHG
ncbi:PLD nuclease N-terminal domain-containing protein [Kiloniella sp.]|uniref:PLD nuclease N-terminal domain-containing protein n=1 Tax=Kiloniella sp. TaxID=1938587 RepID=UPI003B022A32